MDKKQAQEVWTLSRDDSESRFGEVCADCYQTSPSFSVTWGGSGGEGICSTCADKRILRWLSERETDSVSENDLNFAARFGLDFFYDVVTLERAGSMERLIISRFPD